MIRVLTILTAVVALGFSPQAASAGTSNTISITKSVDKASPNLLDSCSTGRHIPELLL